MATTTLTPVKGTGSDVTLTMKEAAQLLKVDEKTLRAHLDDYAGTFMRIGNQYRFSRPRLERRIDERCEETAGG